MPLVLAGEIVNLRTVSTLSSTLFIRANFNNVSQEIKTILDMILTAPL